LVFDAWDLEFKQEGLFSHEKIVPVKATKEICRLLKPGDTINLELGKSGKLWHILEVGNVYPE